jgi:hypothetical protein
MKLSSFMTVLAIRDAVRGAATTRSAPPREDLEALIADLEADLRDDRAPTRATVQRAVEFLREYRDAGKT